MLRCHTKVYNMFVNNRKYTQASKYVNLSFMIKMVYKKRMMLSILQISLNATFILRLQNHSSKINGQRISITCSLSIAIFQL